MGIASPVHGPITMVAVHGDPDAVHRALSYFPMAIPPTVLTPLAEFAIRLAIAGQPRELPPEPSQGR